MPVLGQIKEVINENLPFYENKGMFYMPILGPIKKTINISIPF